MLLLQQSTELQDYLQETDYINYSHASIQEKAQELFEGVSAEADIVKIGYEFVRDEIHHSADISSHIITRTASEVLIHKHGMCYAKTILLAALLRSRKIPTGFCYQSLAEQDCLNCKHNIHALNAVYLSDIQQWIRIDPRGNTGEKNAQFNLDNPACEQLAYEIRDAYGEAEYNTIFLQHPDCVMHPLLLCEDCQEMMRYHLPDKIWI